MHYQPFRYCQVADPLTVARQSLENPPLLIVSDIKAIVVHTNFTNSAKRVVTFTLERLLEPGAVEHLRAAWLDPEHFKAKETVEVVTTKAAAKFAQLADTLRAADVPPERAAHFLIRLLFCLFAEDIGLLPAGLFTKIVTGARRKPVLFNQQLRQLFGAMAEGSSFGADEIIHINGKLFDSEDVVDLDSDGIWQLWEACELDWSSIEPAILGTLFERSLDPSKRAQLGAHYTSRQDILLIVEPVLMAPLRQKWGQVRGEAEALAARREGSSGAAAIRHQAALRDVVVGFAQELSSVQVLDPACGSGNFLYVALRELLDLWKEVSTTGAILGLPLGLRRNFGQ